MIPKKKKTTEIYNHKSRKLQEFIRKCHPKPIQYGPERPANETYVYAESEYVRICLRKERQK